MPKFRVSAAVALTAVALARVAHAGVVNPDISVIGQPFMFFTDQPGAVDPNRVRFDIGETELVFDAYLNPYARGTFVMSLGATGIELEEGYFNLFRGLPLQLALKGGKYRVGFGHLNSVHPHALPFAERFNVLAAYLPGGSVERDRGVAVGADSRARGLLAQPGGRLAAR